MKQLPAETVRLLSSSQVITSVLSVVKELLENSLDAGATSVEVKLENYGLDRIEVRDNGCGIKASDTSVMAVRHYTSKISCHDDLEHLETYGFRGEALGSICAVSEVVVTTKTAADAVSRQYTLDATGSIISQKPSHLGQGTTVCVLKLFKNLPVRRQFCSSSKKCKEELKKLQDLLMAYSIIKPELCVLFTHNKAVVWQKFRVSDHRTALMAVLGTALVNSMQPLQHRQEQPEITIDGYFPKPDSDFTLMSSSNSDRTFVFVNNRPVRHKDILKLVKQQYSSQCTKESRYPTLMMSITVPLASVDVNLTPDKTQVLLHNKEDVLSAVEAMLTLLYGRSTETPLVLGENNGAQTATENPSNSSVSTDKGTDSPVGPDVPMGAAAKVKSGAQCDTGKDPTPNQSANTSSSSTLDDWVFNSSTFECDLGHSVSCSEERGCDSAEVPVTLPEITPEDWSAGRGLLDPETGNPLEPVLIHTADGGIEGEKVSPAHDVFSGCGTPNPTDALEERWKILGPDRRKNHEEQSEKEPGHHHSLPKQTLEKCTPAPKRSSLSFLSGKAQVCKRKTPLSNQQILDQLFSSQPTKKKPAKPTKAVSFNLSELRRRLPLSVSQGRPEGLRLVNRLPSNATWVVLRSQRLMLLNTSRVEEALLFRRLLEDNVVPAATLETPIQLTDSMLGGVENTDALCQMEKAEAELGGAIHLSDSRLVANGFQVQIFPASASAERRLEVTGMADCLPFFGIADLREILTAVVKRNATSVKDCRPRKVYSYLEGEAVRLVRQLPLTLSKEEVQETLSRMEQQLTGEMHTCIHGRPFFHHLIDLP